QLNRALVLCAQARNTARHDLAAFGHEVAQGLRIFVVDGLRVVRAIGVAAPATAAAERRVQIFVAAVTLARALAITVSALLFHWAFSSSRAGTSPLKSSLSPSSLLSMGRLRSRSRSGESTKPSMRSIDSSGSSSPGG